MENQGVGRLTYPFDWASSNGWTDERLEIDEAKRFVSSVRGLQFGEILEIESNKEQFPGEGVDEVRKNTEEQLQEDLREVEEWISTLDQKTISQKKVIAKIEDTTGFKFEFTR